MNKKGRGKTVLLCVASGIFGAAVVFLILSTYLGGVKFLPMAAKFASAYSILDKKYIGEADMDEVLDMTYRAMVDSVGDRWSLYMNAEEYESYRQTQNNTYTGIGITVTNEDGSFPLVVQVAKNSPALEAGIVPGDRLGKMDGQSLEGVDSGDIRGMITAKNGGKFTLTLIDKDGGERDVELRAAEIFTDPVEYEMLSGDIAYIRIGNFEAGSGKSAIAALEDLMEQGARGVVFDVRNNPGGFLSELTKLLDYLLPEGEMFVSVDQDGEEQVTWSDADCVELPMAVLVNGNTYSAAEFFAAALSEYEMAGIVGEPTTGKSRSQVNLFLPDGSVIHLSTNGYLTPDRVDLAEQGGLVPDHEVVLSEEEQLSLLMDELEPEEDRQLQRAVEVLFKPAA